MDRCDICKHKDSCVCVPYGCECFEIDLSEHDKQIRAEVIEEVNIILKNMYLEISNTVNGNDYTSKNDLVTVVASKCRRYVSEKLKEQEHG